MIRDDAREMVAHSDPDERILLIVTIDALSEMRALATIPDPVERGKAFNALIANKKDPVLLALSPYKNAGLRILHNSSGATELILSAPARIWKRVIKEQPIFENEAVRLKPDTVTFVSL